MTNILDAQVAPALELAALYHERWEIEGVFDEFKTPQAIRATVGPPSRQQKTRRRRVSGRLPGCPAQPMCNPPLTEKYVLSFRDFIDGDGDQLTTGTPMMAADFSKRHAHVLRATEKLMTDCPAEFAERNFALSEIKSRTAWAAPALLQRTLKTDG